MKEAWVRLTQWSKEMVTTALENGADALIIPAGWHDKVKALGRITTVSEDGDLKPGQDVFFERLATAEDEARIARLLAQATVVLESAGVEQNTEGENRTDVKSPDWEIIPLENLVARGGRLLVPVESLQEIELALGILEHGVTGVVINGQRSDQLKKLLKRAKHVGSKESLQIATIERIRPAGLGDRVCVDTCTLMQEGEGMLVGNSSAFLFLVQAEAKPNPYVSPRPFRVNAGPVHAYVRTDGDKTRYLSELQAGDTVLVVRSQGDTQEAIVGRVKIERRPLLLIEASCENINGSILLQNAETIRLTQPEGGARSVVELQPGDQVLVALGEAGRHFGIQVEETIWER